MKKNYYECVRKNTIVDILFNRMMRHEIENVWNEGKAKNRKKVEFLCNKWKSDFENENVDTRGVQYKDIELGVELCDKNEEVIKYGKAEITENMSEVLKLNPKFILYNKIVENDIEAEVEKGIMKARYSMLSKDKN